MEKSNKTSGGMSLAGVILVVFIILKLVGVINWSWLWVLSPLWIPLVLALLFFILAAIARAFGI